jgi:beta-lactamase class D
VKDILVLKETAEYRLSGKSGTLDLTAGRELTWHVGYIERGRRVWFYALNMEGDRVWEDWPPRRRVELVCEICGELGVIPPVRSDSRPSR